MKIIRLEDANNAIFETICTWNYNWWGVRDGLSFEEVRYNFLYSLQTDRLPQTVVALIDEEPVGMYQIAMTDDLISRPDLYPWLINVYVEPQHRGKGVASALLQTIPAYAKAAGLHELYLYTVHVGLYEKFGWTYVGEIPTFREASPIERLYKFTID